MKKIVTLCTDQESGQYLAMTQPEDKSKTLTASSYISELEAVGRLIQQYPDYFGVEIESVPATSEPTG